MSIRSAVGAVYQTFTLSCSRIEYQRTASNSASSTMHVTPQASGATRPYEVPVTQPLAVLKGDLDAITDQLEQWRGAAQRRGLQLIDISDYTPDEARVLQTSHGGWVTLARQQLNSLQDTLRLMQRAEAIATVDTSLGHLAVLCRRQVNLLLPLWPDERWYDLLADGLYRELTTVHQQTRFHSWDEPLTALSRVLQLTR